MSKPKMYFLGLCAVILYGLYYYYLSPDQRKKWAVESALFELRDAAEASERKRVGYVIEDYLAPSAKVRLNVHFFKMLKPEGAPQSLTFDEPSLINFVDNILYSMQMYRFEPQLDLFELNDDKNIASVAFRADAWSDGETHYAGVKVMSRFSADVDCKARVVYAKGDSDPLIQEMTCDVHVRVVPKADEASKISQNPEALKQLLLEQ